MLLCSTTCSLSETSAFIWYKNDHLIDTKNSNNALTLHLTKADDAGRYNCAVRGYENLRSPAGTLNVRCEYMWMHYSLLCRVDWAWWFVYQLSIVMDGKWPCGKFWASEVVLTSNWLAGFKCHPKPWTLNKLCSKKCSKVIVKLMIRFSAGWCTTFFSYYVVCTYSMLLTSEVIGDLCRLKIF